MLLTTRLVAVSNNVHYFKFKGLFKTPEACPKPSCKKKSRVIDQSAAEDQVLWTVDHLMGRGLLDVRGLDGGSLDGRVRS